MILRLMFFLHKYQGYAKAHRVYHATCLSSKLVGVFFTKAPWENLSVGSISQALPLNFPNGPTAACSWHSENS